MPIFVPDLPEEVILACLKRAPGHEINSGKFDGPESSAALVANGFGWFIERPGELPPLPGVPAGKPLAVTLEAEMRYPWGGGRHPRVDVGISTPTTLIGIESTRYEPFRPARNTGFAEVYDRPVWGERMGRYTQMQRDLVSGAVAFECLDAVQLIKQAYGLRTRAEKRATGSVLVYLYAEPGEWASGKAVDPGRIEAHRREVQAFGAAVAGDEVVFVALRWAVLLRQWARVPKLAAHAEAMRARFGVLG